MRIKPQLNFYVGRSITKLSSTRTGDARISLGDGIQVVIEGLTFPEELQEKQILLRITETESDTNLDFGVTPEGQDPIILCALVFSSTSYRIVDKAFQLDKPYYPNRFDLEEDMNTPPDPSPDRIVDGPS